jgi:hypothetical protein
VGLAVGVRVGRLEGKGVGAWLGTREGVRVGCVGRRVGCWEGARGARLGTPEGPGREGRRGQGTVGAGVVLSVRRTAAWEMLVNNMPRKL